MLYHVSIRGHDQIMTALRQVHGKELDLAAMEGLVRYAHQVRSRATADFRSKGVGKHLYGVGFGRFGRTEGQAVPLYVGKPRETSSGYRVEITGRGWVAMQETGGRTEPHVIDIKRDEVQALRFAGKDGIAFADIVHHPGGPVQAHPSIWPAIEGSAEDLTRSLADAVDLLMRRVGF